ncbi:MAG TPA: TRAP transporter small permease subunit [Rhodobacteraceae bacterium]|nr:TRAP transporter small permease subunit [Paracoccaceae bacterium]
MRDWQPFLGLPLWVWLFVLPVLLAGFCLVQRRTAGKLLTPVWRVLDRIYLVSGVIAAGFMVLILLLIVAQMFARWSGLTFPGSTEYAGYAMAATSFFALAHALMRGAHIRVSIFLNMNRFTRIWLDAAATLIAAIIATYFARFAIKTNILSKLLNDRTQGQDFVPEWLISFFRMFANPPTKWGEIWANTGSEWVYTPMWLPQLPMSVGTVLLAIALWDALTRLLVTREPAIKGEAIE